MPRRKLVIAVVLALVNVVGGGFVGDGLPRVEAACSISASLRLGSGGAPVQCLQTTLNGQGYNSGPVDGRFGPMTYRAVVRFQQAKRLYVDGVVGRQTGTALGIWGAAAAGGGTPAGGRNVVGRRDCSGQLPPPAARSTPRCVAARPGPRSAASSHG